MELEMPADAHALRFTERVPENFGAAEDASRAPHEGAQALMNLARDLGNVSEACRRIGVDRSEYYRALKRKARTSAPAPRPNATPPEVARRLLDLCLQYPEWGCDRLAHYLTLTGDAISSPTAQKILIRHGLGRIALRRARVRTRAEQDLQED